MEPDEMDIEVLDAVYGRPRRLSLVTHVLAHQGNLYHDRIIVEVATDDLTRWEIPFTQQAIKSLVNLLAMTGDLGPDRPKVN